MTFISGEVFFVDKEIMVCVKFPEAAVKNIKVLIWKVLSDFIYVFFVCYLPKNSL